MEREDKRKIIIGIAVASFAILFYLVLQNFTAVKEFAKTIISMLSPFIIGLCIAFVLNLFMRMFEEKVLSKINEKKHPKLCKAKRGIAVGVTIILFFGVLTAILAFVLPQITDSVKTLVANFSSYLASLERFATRVLDWFGISGDVGETITSYLSQITDKIITFISTAVPQIYEATKSITSGVVNSLVGFIVGIYMLVGKESLLKNTKRVLYAFVPQKGADYFMHVYRLAKVRFSGFVTGQLTEAVIITILCFIGMSIFQMEYALLISIIIGVTNIIPIIGPIIGAIPGALILLMIDPMKALWFVIFIIVLQQLESNLIYPKVVGDSIGLPGIWVLFSIMIGGALFGFAGIVLGVPAFAVIYTLIGEHVEKRLAAKKIKEDPITK